MQQIIKFFIRNQNFLLFLLLLIISLTLTIQSHSYHKSKFIHSANWLSGSIYKISNDVSSYFSLKEQNNLLIEENKKLRTLLFNTKPKSEAVFSSDSSASTYNYKMYTARVIKNSFAHPKNYLTINLGENDGIKQDMGVITSNGMVGIVENTSSNFATVQSVLNKQSKINAKLQKSGHFGTLTWNTKKPNVVQLLDIPQLAAVKIGDSVITGGMSAIFPEGIAIGVVKKYELDSSKNYYVIDVELFNDMTRLQYVYIIENTVKAEILQLEEEISDE